MKLPGRIAMIAPLLAAAASVPLAAGIRTPPPRGEWDWQLSRPLNLDVSVKILGLDPDLVRATDIRRLKKRGIYLICYVSVGTWENWRRDRKSFPRSVLGRTYGEWPDERFLDIRQIDVLLPIMRKRFRRCRMLGFDAVEADNMDVHDNPSGFPLTAGDTVRYVRALAREAHALGLAMAQKNVPELSGRLVDTLDFAITESCFRDGWCRRMRPWLRRSRAVLDAEYRDRPPDMRRACRNARRLGISLILKGRDLTRWRRTCRDFRQKRNVPHHQ